MIQRLCTNTEGTQNVKAGSNEAKYLLFFVYVFNILLVHFDIQPAKKRGKKTTNFLIKYTMIEVYIASLNKQKILLQQHFDTLLYLEIL